MYNDRIVFIVPYYGKFPEYFREWVYSAGFLAEQRIDFLLVTDIDIDFELPENVYLYKLSFNRLREKIQKKFEFKIALETPYKLCDFKATLGMVFEEEISDYAFWGNCDIDQVWGNVRKFVTSDILNEYDRIQFLGHFILYRNCKKMNEAFKLKGAIYDYKHVLSSPIHYSFCEHSGMMKIIEENEISNYLCINYADLSPRYTRMFISRQKNYRYQILYWENGHVKRAYIDKNGEVKEDEYMYFHFQRKHPRTLKCWSEGRKPLRILYSAEKFVELSDTPITNEYIIQNSDFVSEDKDRKEEKQYILGKFKKFVKASWKGKMIWIKQRSATRKVIKNERYFGKNYSNI